MVQNSVYQAKYEAERNSAGDISQRDDQKCEVLMITKGLTKLINTLLVKKV